MTDNAAIRAIKEIWGTLPAVLSDGSIKVPGSHETFAELEKHHIAIIASQYAPLRTAFKRYARHDRDCSLGASPYCNCGFAEALAAVEDSDEHQ